MTNGVNFSSARVSDSNVEQQFPKFKGKVIKRDDANYEAQCYQYASSSYLEEDIIQPAAIIKAADDSDVIKAIKYASDNKIAVAVRTGGHQYSGASSTSGRNIQLDLSQTYRDFEWEDENCTSVTFGVSFSLGEFNAKLREKNRFVPHGQCQYVYMGGHIQTGGYGQLARSFGLLSDHVKKFRIITADGQVHWVCRNLYQDQDLFFAVLGGSPGNFGVLTHVSLHVFRDQDHPNSRGLRAAYPYDRQRFKALLNVMVEMAEDENFPADYDYCIMVSEECQFDTKELTYDMIYDRTPHQVVWPRMIVVFAQWSNLQGDQQSYNPNFIDKIRQVAGKGIIQVSDKVYTPMSKLTSHWIIPISREFKYPYVKRTYSSNSSSQRLKDLRWTDWVYDRIEVGHCLSLKLSAQFQHIGGSNSRFFQNGKNSPTSFSWRDTRLGCTMDAFYHSGQREQAIKWQQGNDEGVGKPKAKFCEHDRRVLWGSHDLDLSANQQYYYDQHPEGKYERLCNIKQKYDPSGLFTPNRFCIGLSVSMQLIIKLADSEIAKEVVTDMELQDKSQLSSKDKFWKIAKMEREDGKPVPLWDIWRA
ncbi:4360_t:CDS:1 [Funneliformis mosseae]|uniref:4360_t:CDS:1 n=1 Tax=Funneliformis mosseae TaxID=27381 RepID=A0A9N9A4F6_FUNMO|nr:4360_t:CDS:1 [Funneliformis mosseae]